MREDVWWVGVQVGMWVGMQVGVCLCGREDVQVVVVQQCMGMCEGRCVPDGQVGGGECVHGCMNEGGRESMHVEEHVGGHGDLHT